MPGSRRRSAPRRRRASRPVGPPRRTRARTSRRPTPPPRRRPACSSRTRSIRSASAGHVQVPVEARELARGVEEQARDHHGLRNRSLDVARRLERLVRLGREAVQVEAVVPVGVADQRQPVRAAVRERVGDARLQVVQQVLAAAGRVRVADRLREDRRVAGLLDVRARRERRARGGRRRSRRRSPRSPAASAAGTGGSRFRRESCVAARSRMRRRARSGIRWTKPSTSWFESRKPIPRPIPVSNRLAERDRLKVAMHWYWFQVFSIRRRAGRGMRPGTGTAARPSARQPASASSTAAGSE